MRVFSLKNTPVTKYLPHDIAITNEVILPNTKQLAHYAIQGANIFGKFMLMLGLARFLDLSDLGLYATTIAAFGILQPMMNLQFGRYTYRGCASATPEEVVHHMRHYIGLLLCMLCIGTPIMGAYVQTSLEAEHVFWVVLLLVANVLAMEISNLLMVRQYSTRYMIAVFIGQSAWIYVLLGLWLFELRTPDLIDVWRFWAVSACASLCMSLIVVRRYPWRRTLWAFDWPWMKEGLRVSPMNLAVLICGIGILNSTIFFVKHYHGLEAAGVYGFFFAVILGIRQWVMGGSYVMQEPKLFKNWDAENIAGFKHETRVMFRDSLMAYGVAALIAIPGIYLVLGATNEAIPESAMPLYWGFLAAAAMVLMCDLGQVVGFAQRAWGRLATLNAIALVVHIGLCAFIMTQFDYIYAFLPILISSCVRFFLYWRHLFPVAQQQ